MPVVTRCIELKDGKLSYIKNNWNPLTFLHAVHADVPIFRMDMNDPRVDAFMRENPVPAAASSTRGRWKKLILHKLYGEPAYMK